VRRPVNCTEPVSSAFVSVPLRARLRIFRLSFCGCEVNRPIVFKLPRLPVVEHQTGKVFPSSVRVSGRLQTHPWKVMSSIGNGRGPPNFSPGGRGGEQKRIQIDVVNGYFPVERPSGPGQGPSVIPPVDGALRSWRS